MLIGSTNDTRAPQALMLVFRKTTMKKTFLTLCASTLSATAPCVPVPEVFHAG
jgi:hypothetical protein